MIQYDNPALKHLEEEIKLTYDGWDGDDYTRSKGLLRARKSFLNEQALAHQAELLPDIIAFNDALRDALKQMYNRAHQLYEQISAIQPSIELEAKCYLSSGDPSLQPYQAHVRQELWEALCDTGWNPLYDSGVTHSLELPRDLDLSFESFIGMDIPPTNWNEGLDQELTKDLHLINAFHNLFDHTNFALTDFIFIREFNIEININLEEPIKSSYAGLN